VNNLLLSHSLNCVVFALNRDGDLNNILNDLFDNLFHRVWDFHVFDLFHWYSDDFNNWIWNIIWDFDSLFNNSVDLVWDWTVHDFLHRVGYPDLDGVGCWNGGGNWNVAGDDLLNHLLYWIGDWLVNQTGNWYWNLHGHLHNNLSWYLT